MTSLSSSEANKDQTKEKVQVQLVHKKNNLTELIYDLKEAGHEPVIKYEAGHITRIIVVANNVSFCIQTQQLVKDSMDGDVSVATEEIYNRMNQAMATFNQALIKPEYKSYYSKTDADVPDEYRTTVPIGR